MLVTLIGQNSMHKILLPKTVVGNYWISDKTGKEEKKLINIESQDGNWKIISNNNAKIIDLKSVQINDGEVRAISDSEKVEKEITLRENSMHGIFLTSIKEFFIICCLPAYDKKLIKYDIKNTQEIHIGSGLQNHIIYNNELVDNFHARIILNNGRLFLENYDKNFGTFVNRIPVKKESRVLFNGDVIFIMGLKIIVIGNSLLINNPKGEVKVNGNNLVPSKYKEQAIIESDEDENIELDLYSDKDYYSRAPRITNIIETETVKIDAPPQQQDKQETPMILVLGSTLSMGAMMILSMISTVGNGLNGTADKQQTTFSLIMTAIMLIGIMVFPILNIKYEKKEKKKYEKKRQKRYKEYLKTKSSEITLIKNKQRSILYKNYLSAEECTKIILNREPRLWERKIEDYDFLSIRIGIGDMPLKIEVQYPEKQFSMEDDNLVEILNEIGDNSKTLNGAPIVTSLAEKNVAAFVKQDEENFEKFMQNIMVQLVAFQSYEDLKLVFLLDEDKQKKWEYVKMLPHLWDANHDIRFFADNYDDMKEISQYLEEVLRSRLESEGEDYRSFMPYYLIITDDYKKIENLKFIREILKYSKHNMGFSLLCITEDITQLPNECKTFVNIDNKKGMIFDNEISSSNHRQIALEVANTFFFGKIWQAIANIPIRSIRAGNTALPNNFTFLEMFDVGLIEQLNILERWKKNDSTLSLKAQIGVDDNRMPIVLDIHEKFHGPHGLVAGSTGSGKSEFLITYILSLAINYHPDDVTFLLIDYKGGGLAGAFKKNDIKLPHLVGTITNIDTNGLQRSLASIHSEVTRRQVVFNEARNKIEEGTIDIYKYQKLYHDGIVDEPISHLIIICDEFAELKQQQEEFMDELISISRIGRSLGVHLILATQKPAGIVNDQIRSNSKFAICLKVQDREDSMDVIKKPDAANLRNAGQFYMQVGNDDYFILGQSAWSGAPYFPADTTKKKIDNSIEFISNTGMPIKKLDDSKQQISSNEGEQLTNIVKYIYNIAKDEEIVTNNLWLDNVPETIYVDKTMKKYHIKPNNNIRAFIGEYDDPYNQSQGIVDLNLSKDGNIVVFGNAESGKETLLSTVVYNLTTTYSSEQIQMYLLDFGSEALKIFKNCPHVGDVIFMGEEEKINRFFSMIQEEIARRKNLLSDYNGDYNLYIESGKEAMPMELIIINNYEAFIENYELEYEDLLLTLTREGIKYGIVFLVTASAYNDMRYRMGQNFKRKIALQLNKDDDYYNVFEKVGKKRPAPIFGRGLVSISDEIYEFQTAKVCEAGEFNVFINNTIEKIKQENKVNARPIPVLPDRVSLDDVRKAIKDIRSVPIGIVEKTLKPFTYNFKNNFMTMITSKKPNDIIDYCYYIMEVLKLIPNVNPLIINADKKMQNGNNSFANIYNELVIQIEENSNHDEHNICIITGIDKFIEIIDDIQFTELLEKAEKNGNYSFVIAESSSKIKEHTYDKWYKEYLIEDSGIWIGSGFDSQYLIPITGDRRTINDNCGRDFGYVIKDGLFKSIKLLGMKVEGDEDE